MSFEADRAVKRWIKQPGPGQFRGEGEWQEFEGTEADWEWYRTHDYLPIHEGEKPPEGDE